MDVELPQQLKTFSGLELEAKLDHQIAGIRVKSRRGRVDFVMASWSLSHAECEFESCPFLIEFH